MSKRLPGMVLLSFAMTGFVAALVATQILSPAKAQDPVTIGAIALSGKLVVGDILNDAEEKANKLIDRSRFSGDAVAAHGAAELHLMIANLRVLFEDSQKSTFDQLTNLQQRLFVNLNTTIDRIQEGGALRELTELMALDLEEFSRRTVLAKEGQEFYVSSIRGTTLVQQEHDYEIRVAGLGFGYKVKGGESTSIVDAAVKGKDLDFGSLQQKENHIVLIKIPAKRIEKDFHDDKLATVPFTFRVGITKVVKDKPQTKNYEVTVPLVLMPRAAGSITVEEVVEHKEWGNPQTKTITLTRNNEGDPLQRTEKWTCADNQRITGAVYECKDPRAGWCYSQRGKDYDPDFDITDANRTAVVYRKMDSFPLTCHYHIKYESLAPVTKTETNGTYKLKYDEPLEVLLSTNNGKGNFKITGKLFDGRKIALNSETAPTDRTSPLRLIGVGAAGDRMRATFVLKANPSTP